MSSAVWEEPPLTPDTLIEDSCLPLRAPWRDAAHRALLLASDGDTLIGCAENGTFTAFLKVLPLAKCY